MASSVITVEPVESKAERRRFADVPYLLHGRDERWSPGVRAYESWRLDERRHPYFERAEAAFLLARVGGRPAGRIAAHVARVGDRAGFFGFFETSGEEVTGPLLDAAQAWLDEHGAVSMTGPVSWTPDEEFGVVTVGAEHRALTGRTWCPASYADQLGAAGLEPGEERSTYRLETIPVEDADVPGVGGDPPPHAGGYGDPALVLDRVAAVPDVSAALRRASIRSAWSVARRARDRAFETAVCVRCDGDAAVLVPRLQAAAGAAGYRWLVAPWAPPGIDPETTHQVFSRAW